jgi:hypothetical protein
MSGSAPEAIVNLAGVLGVENITALPGCWEHQIDDQWWLALNGKKTPTKCSHGAEVPPFHFYVEFNGWPAGIFSIRGDGEFAAGSAANEDMFIAAVDAAVERARKEPAA